MAKCDNTWYFIAVTFIIYPLLAWLPCSKSLYVYVLEARNAIYVLHFRFSQSLCDTNEPKKGCIYGHFRKWYVTLIDKPVIFDVECATQEVSPLQAFILFCVWIFDEVLSLRVLTRENSSSSKQVAVKCHTELVFVQNVSKISTSCLYSLCASIS